jgi:riboflavin synthase
MFTGIVEELGEVAGIEHREDAARLTIRGSTEDTSLGDSIAVNGVCLTVAEIVDGTFTADVMGETLDRSGLGVLTSGSPVNLERSVRLADRLGGHLVQGHVDATATIISRTPTAHWDQVRIQLPGRISRYVVEKGSIAVDGISLTVAGLAADRFDIMVVPFTMQHTNLGRITIRDRVNLECDMVGKYVVRAAELAGLTLNVRPGEKTH